MRPAPLHRAYFKHFITLPTRWGDNDMFNHVNNAVYFQWFDTIVNTWMMSSFGYVPLNSSFVALVAETKCNYFKEVSFPDPVDLGLACVHIGNASVQYHIGVFAQNAPETNALGLFTQVVVDAASRKPVKALPATFLNALHTIKA
jgi:acyl-CoA thioester hydrolase